MKNEGWDDISEGWGGLGCSEGIPTGIATETI